MSDSTVTTAHPAGLRFPQTDDDNGNGNGGDVVTRGLSPWPTDTAAIADAVARLKSVIGGRSKSDDDSEHLGATASALVEDYAADAPQAIKDEAVIRLAGWLAQSSFDNIVSETSVGSATTQYMPGSQNMLIRSGAAGLLTRWKPRHAGVIG